MNESMYCSDGGNTVCHLKTDAVEFLLFSNSFGGAALEVGPETAGSSCKVNELGRDGKGSGELAGEKGSKLKEGHSGSGSRESDFKVGESEGSVDDSVADSVCEDFEVGNTETMDEDKIGDKDEVVELEEMMDVDFSGVKYC